MDAFCFLWPLLAAKPFLKFHFAQGDELFLIAQERGVLHLHFML